MIPIYQITARRTGMPVQTVTVSSKPLHFGSGENTDLILHDPRIPPIAGRLFISSGNQILLFNLGALDIRFTLDGAQVPSLQPTIWKSGAQLQISDYTLDLKTIDIPLPKRTLDETPLEASSLSADAQSTRPPLISPTPIPAVLPAPLPDVLPEIATYVGQSIPPSPPKPQPLLQLVDEDKDTVRGIEGFRALDSANVEITEPVETGAKQWLGYSSNERQTQAMPPRIEVDSSEDQEGFTRFKNWMEQDKLSVQLGLKTINFALGERIMLPFSVQNNYSHPLELLPRVTGLPADWKIIDVPVIALVAGELKTFEIIILTRATAVTKPLDVFLNLTDRVTPEIKATLPLPITLKTQPDLIGYFEQSHVPVPGSVYLTLQNQTLSTEKVRLSIGPHNPAIRILFPNSEIELTPYQKLRVPVRVEVVKFPHFISRNCALHISAQQGTRAPLDLFTVVSVQPSLLRYLLLITIGLLGALLLLITRPNGVASIVATYTETFTPPPTAIMTDIPTAVPQVIPPTEAAIPTNTLLPFADPRSSDCQANIPVPSGWIVYSVKSGENLYRIALNHGISDNELARVNCITNKKIITLGQAIIVPPAS